MGIQKVMTSPYHAQANEQVEWAHQILVHMIGKWGRDQKADWPKHVPKLVHAYNSTRLTITGYSLHYLMYGCQLHLPTDFYFPTIGGTKRHQYVGHYITELCEWLWEALKRLRCSPHQRWRDKSSTMIGRLMPFHWNQVTWSWLRLIPTGGGGKWRIGWRRNHMKWNARLLRVSLPTLWGTSRQDAHESSTKTNFSSSLLQRGLLSVWLYVLSGPGAPPPP